MPPRVSPAPGLLSTARVELLERALGLLLFSLMVSTAGDLLACSWKACAYSGLDVW